MPLVVPQGALLRLIWTQGGVPAAVNVFGVLNTGNVAITQTLTNTIGAAVKAGFTSSTQATFVHTTIALASIGLRDVRTANQPEFLEAAAAVPGTGTGDLLPLNVSLCITLRTALAGRSFRGRTYLWGYTEAANASNGTATPGVPGVGVTFVQAIQSALSNNGMALGVLSRTRSVVNAVTLVQSRDANWETQRRRSIAGI